MTMNEESTPVPSYTFKHFLPATLILALAGWLGLILMITLTVPNLGARWFFFFFIVSAISGTAMPGVYFIHRRFPANPPVEQIVIIRQSIWVGVYFAAAAWLKMGRVLSLGLALILAGVFILIEILLRLWERSRWKPRDDAA